MSKQRTITDSFKEVKSTPKRLNGKRKQREDVPPEAPSSPENVNTTNIPDSNNSFGDHVKVKQTLHLSKPQSLPCRDDQIKEIYSFIHGNVLSRKSGSMYISGAPGTGKTAVVQHVMDKFCNPSSDDKLANVKVVSIFINCMNMNSAQSVFKEIDDKLKSKSKFVSDIKEKIKNRVVSKTARPILLVLDEMDQLLSRSNEILYTLFEWTSLPNSILTLIGIANSLDLTVRHLPLLTASPKNSSPKPAPTSKSSRSILLSSTLPSSVVPCKLVQFAPYEKQDIECILESRINEVGSHLFEPTAIKFVAAKVAATTGDVRKALNACQIALETNERNQRPVLKATADDGFNSSSPKKVCPPDQRIGVTTLSKILGPQKDDGVLPLQQKIILATLLKIYKNAPTSLLIPNNGVVSAIPIEKFYDEYRKICANKGLSWIDRSELSSVCGLLEDRSLVHITASSQSKLTKKTVKRKEGIFFDPRASEKILGNDPIAASIVG